MRSLTFAFDVQLNDEEDWIAEGTVVTEAETSRKIEGFTPVLVTQAFDYQNRPIDVDPYFEYFLSGSFKELR